MKFNTIVNIIKKDKQYNAMCKCDHIQIGYNIFDEDERCPLCRLIDENEMLKGKVEYLKERLRSSYGKSHF